jgi:hypothetical protein
MCCDSAVSEAGARLDCFWCASVGLAAIIGVGVWLAFFIHESFQKINPHPERGWAGKSKIETELCQEPTQNSHPLLHHPRTYGNYHGSAPSAATAGDNE